jgi:hypothetical protein
VVTGHEQPPRGDADHQGGLRVSEVGRQQPVAEEDLEDREAHAGDPDPDRIPVANNGSGRTGHRCSGWSRAQRVGAEGGCKGSAAAWVGLLLPAFDRLVVAASRERLTVPRVPGWTLVHPLGGSFRVATNPLVWRPLGNSPNRKA